MKSIAKWTTEDYHRMIEAGILSDRHVELLAGEIIEMSPESPLHSYHGEKLGDYLRENLKGKALIREARPITLINSEPEPDLAIVKIPRERYRERHPIPEDIYWVVEVSDSSLAKDLVIKTAIYAAAGIQEYWLINLKTKQFIIFRYPDGNNYTYKQELNQGKISPLAFRDLELSIENFLS